jgi:hypothetical protein
MCTIIIAFINLSNLQNIRSTLSWAVLGWAGLQAFEKQSAKPAQFISLGFLFM